MTEETKKLISIWTGRDLQEQPQPPVPPLGARGQRFGFRLPADDEQISVDFDVNSIMLREQFSNSIQFIDPSSLPPPTIDQLMQHVDLDVSMSQDEEEFT
jgi:hypothetical protein